MRVLAAAVWNVTCARASSAVPVSSVTAVARDVTSVRTKVVYGLRVHLTVNSALLLINVGVGLSPPRDSPVRGVQIFPSVDVVRILWVAP